MWFVEGVAGTMQDVRVQAPRDVLLNSVEMCAFKTAVHVAFVPV